MNPNEQHASADDRQTFPSRGDKMSREGMNQLDPVGEPGARELLAQADAHVRLAQVRREAAEAIRQNQAWMAGQKRALQAALGGAPLEESLAVLVNSSMEHYGPTTRAAFYLADRDGKTLYHVVGMGPEYAKKCEGFPIGPDSFACGLAVHAGRPILTADVWQEPLWEQWLWITENFDFRACGSFPLRTSEGKVLGTFAVYWREPHAATPSDVAFANTVADTASIIVARHMEAEERKRAEEALRESEEKYRGIFENIDEGYALIELERDENGRVKDFVWLEVNPAFERHSGVIGIVGKRASELVPNLERDILDLNQRVADTGVPKRLEHYNSDLDHWFDAVHIRVGGEGSNLVGVVFSDVTERKHREQLQGYLLKLIDAIRPIADPIKIQAVAADLLGKHLDVNQAHYGERVGDYIHISYTYANGLPPMTGKFRYEDFGKRMAEGCRSGQVQVCYDAATDPALSEEERQVLASMNIGAYVTLPFMKDAEWVATLAVHSIKPRKWKDHEIELIKETAERTWAAVEWARAEAALRASEERLRSLFDTMGEGVAIMQLVRNDAGDVVDTQYLELNLSFERLTGFGRDVVAGRKTSEVFPLHFAAMQPRLATVKGTAGPERFECFIAETGRWFSCYAAPFGGPDGFAVFFDDVTERKRAEEAVRASEERLRQALCSSQRFHALSARLLAGADTAEVFAEVLEMAVATMEADCASLQIFEPGDGNGQGPALRLVANRGFHPDSALIWERVDVSDTSVCSRVLSTSERAVIEDVEVSNGVADGDQRAYRLSGIRGVQTTPLISRTGRLLGAISTQWRRPHRASERQFASFDVLARQVADLIERAQVDEALRRANEKLEQRVAERTAELAGANDRLREEVRERQRAEAARSELLRKLVSAQEDERRRVARDLHDSVGQFLAGLSLAFKAVEASNGELPPATVAKLHEAKNMADALGKEVHGLAVRLRPTALDDLGLPAALGQLTAEWSTRTGVSADFQTTGLDNGRLPPDIETVLYRVVQEALTNVGKHAQATAVSIVMGRHDGTVTAVVEDNGVGFDAETAGRGRLGLVGMRERVTLAGGELDLESAPGAGATVIARVPVRRES